MVLQKQPLVSVIMPAYNVGRFISDAIKSVLNQTYKNIELIVADDKSSDSTAKIIKKFARIDKRVKPVFLKKKARTIAETRNIAIGHAKGEFYATADADDISLPSRIQKQVAFMQKYKDCQICGSWYTKTTTPNTGRGGEIQYHTWLPKDIESELHLRNVLGGPSNFIRAEAFHKLGKYDEKLKIGEDYNLHVRAIKQGMELRVVPEVFVRYRQRPQSITHDVLAPPWKNPLNLYPPWDAKISAFFFNVPLNKLYEVQTKWINKKLDKFINLKNVILWKGPREAIFVPYFIEWAAKRNVNIVGVTDSNSYCGIEPIKVDSIKKNIENGCRVVICEAGKRRVDAAMFLESLGAKVWKDYIYVVPYLTRLAEINAAKKVQNINKNEKHNSKSRLFN